MGFFDDIKARIFGAPEPEPVPVQTAAIGDSVVAGVAAASAATPVAPVQAPPPAAPTVAAAPAVAATTPPPAAPAVNVAAILDQAVTAKGQTLDWRKSIVDLLKALDIDSSLTARKALAGELGYTGDTADSASMNIWLHKQVIARLAANGGKVPADLLG